MKNKRTARVDRALCVGCGCCVKVCPRDAVAIWGGMFARVDESRCIGCGKCARECPASVIVLEEAAG